VFRGFPIFTVSALALAQGSIYDFGVQLFPPSVAFKVASSFLMVSFSLYTAVALFYSHLNIPCLVFSGRLEL
jgi:hypothetical protein